MSLLKIELDLPEFEKELNINITIKKDGEVVYTASSPSPGDVDILEEKKIEAPKVTKSKTTKKPISGNCMGIDL